MLLPPSGLVRKVFIWMCRIAHGGKFNWLARTRSLLGKIRMEGRVEGTLDIRGLRHTLWNALAGNDLDKWKVGLWGGEALSSTSGGKLVLYRQFKTMPELDPYVRAGVPLAARRVLAGLRAGCILLQIELGRFTCPKTVYEERICKPWGQAVEDRTHFLLLCPTLQDASVQLYTKLLTKFPSYKPILGWLHKQGSNEN